MDSGARTAEVMAKLLQYRCPKCLKLFFKFDKVTGEVEYRMSSQAFDSDDMGNAKYVTCPKCKQDLEITKIGLKAVTRIAAQHKIVEPELVRPTQQRSSIWWWIQRWLTKK